MGGTHFNTGGTQSIILDLLPNQRCHLQLEVGEERHDLQIADLARGSFARQIDGFGSPAFKVHRAIPERQFACTVTLPRYRPHPAKGRGFAYLRIRQTDGHAAWVSPIWFE
ncbi:MAG: hypothetical protein ACREIA_24325 [Opitutaceae bacterium]